MKKYITVAALLAAGTTLFAESKTVVFDFGRTDNDSFKTEDAICIGAGKDKYQGAISKTGGLGIISGNYSFIQEASGGNFNNSATLDSLEEAGWKEHLHSAPLGWSDTFKDGLTCQWNGYSSSGNTFTLTFTGLDTGYYDLSVLGGYYGGDDITSTITVSIAGDGLVCDQTTWTTFDIGANAADESGNGVATKTISLTNGASDEGYVFDISNVYVSGNLTVTIDGGTADGCRTPLNGFVLTQIPEPSAFGMLAGLAALALVASRRRRK